MAFYLFKKTVSGQTVYICGESKRNETPAGTFRANWTENDTILEILFTDSKEPAYPPRLVTQYKKEDGSFYASADELQAAISGFFFRVSVVSSDGLLIPDTETGLYFRIKIRDSMFYVDKQLTVTGFTGVEGTDWETVGGF